MFGKKKTEKPEGYNYKPRQYDRDEKIEIQKIVSKIPVTRKLLSQELLVTAINNFAVKNIKIGSAAAHNVNTTKNPYLFFKSLGELIESTEELQKIEPYWRFEGRTPSEQLEEIAERKEKIVNGFICETFTELVEEIKKQRSPSKKQKLFDDYQNALLVNSELMGEESFEYFKKLCNEKLDITDGEKD